MLIKRRTAGYALSGASANPLHAIWVIKKSFIKKAIRGFGDALQVGLMIAGPQRLAKRLTGIYLPERPAKVTSS